MSGIAGVGAGVVDQITIGELMEAPRLVWRHKWAPFVNRLAGDAQGARYGSLTAKVADCIGAFHGCAESTPVDCIVKRSGLFKSSSGGQESPIGYSPMKKPPRVSPLAYFNGDVIRKLREDRGLSQPQLGELVGTTKGNISKWELARSPVAISYDLFLDLARALYIAPEELARRLSTPPTSAPPPEPERRQGRA